MSKRNGGFQLCAVLAAVLAAGAAHAESLADALALAYQTNPTLQAQRAQQRVLDETYVQARAGYRPTVSASADASYQERGSSDSDSASVALTASQPIYTGGRVSAAVTGAQADILSGRESLRQVEATVLQTVIQAYVDVRRDQQAVAIRQGNLEVLRKQVEESQARFDVGEITRTDVAQAEAQAAQARALLASSQAQLAISQAAYAAAVGQNPGQLEPEPPLPAQPATIDEAFAAAEAANPTLRAAEYAEQASRARVAAARAERMPSVSVRATLGYAGPLSNFEPNDYDRSLTASATVSQPLFSGGVISSRIRQAVERNNTDRIRVEGARRDTLQRLSQAWSQMLAARSNISATEEMVRAARIAFEGTLEERKVGLRTTLEVLNAQQVLRDSELSLVNARRDEYVATAAVLNVIGRLEATTVTPTVPLYDPVKSFNRVKNAGFVLWEPIVAGLDSVGSPTVKALPTTPRAATPVAVAAPAR